MKEEISLASSVLAANTAAYKLRVAAVGPFIDALREALAAPSA